MSNLYWCVCRRHGGRRVQVGRTTYYDHLCEAETDEEREQIINAQDDPEAIQLICKYLSKRCASPTHAPPGKRTRTASPHHRNDEPMSLSNDENMQPQDNEPPHPPNDENLQPRDNEPPHPPNDENLQPRDNEPPHPPNDEPHQPQNDEPPHPPNDEPPHPPNDEPAANQPQPPNPPGIDIDELEQLSQLPKLHQAFSFIQALRAASLDDPVAKLTPEALEKLRNPPQQPPHIASPIIRHGIEMYFHLEHAAQAAYKGIADSAARSFPGAEDIPSYRGVERLVAELSGIDSIKHHMCLNTCIAFTGPFSDLDQCPFCDSHRYDQLKLEATGKQVPVREFHTIPLGPQLQALWRDPESAGHMHYRRERTAAIFQYLQQHDGELHIIDDFICGSNYLEAVMQGRINENDTVLMISMDGAQLYRSKISDCWIYIWVIYMVKTEIGFKVQNFFFFLGWYIF